MTDYRTSDEIEIAVAHYFGERTHIIVPNVSWGMFDYELDLCILNNRSGYASEVEIKVSKSDLVRDKKKRHKHNLYSIRWLWFAMPEKMECCQDLVPERAGIILVSPKGLIRIARKAKANATAPKWTMEKAFLLARLGTLRIWPLKRAAMSRKQKHELPVITEPQP